MKVTRAEWLANTAALMASGESVEVTDEEDRIVAWVFPNHECPACSFQVHDPCPSIAHDAPVSGSTFRDAMERIATLKTALTSAREGLVATYRHIDEDREMKAMKKIRDITDALDAAIATLPKEEP